MRVPRPTNCIKDNMIITSPELNKALSSSKTYNNFIKQSCSHSCCLTDNQTNLSLNSISSKSINTSIESSIFSNDSSFNDINKNIFVINQNFNEQKNVKTFLGQKRKIQFNVQKDVKKSPIFITINNKENSKYKLSNFAIDNSNMNKNSSNIPTYNSTESTFLNKETEKKELLEKTDPKKEKPLLFNTINYSLFENLIKKNMNEGRWSQNEHIKFLRAYVNFCKEYKLSQKYIGSRNSTQIRSHAQKFFRKLKTLKNDQFDFTVDSIKSLSDIFELIKASNKTNLDNKECLVNTLIDISKMTIKKGEIILDEKNELNSFKKDIKIIIKKKEGEIAFNNSLLDEENLKKEIIDEIGNNNFNNEKENNFFEDEEINNDNDIMTLDNNLNENVNIGLKELNIDNIYEQNDKIINRKSDLSVKEQNDFSKYANLNININSNFNFDNSYIVLSGDSDIFSQNEIPSEEKNFLIVKKNYQSPYLKFICNYFS